MMSSAPGESPASEYERRLGERRAAAARRVLIGGGVAAVGLLVAFGAVAVATDGFTHPPTGEETFFVFCGGLILAAPGAIVSGYVALRHATALRWRVVAAGAAPWLLLSAVTAWFLFEEML